MAVPYSANVVDLRLCAAALHVEDVIGGNAVEPGAEFAFALERAELGDDLDQHFLRHFFRIMRLKDHADRDVVNPRLVSQDELLQRRAVAACRPPHKLDVVNIAILDCRKRIVHTNLRVVRPSKVGRPLYLTRVTGECDNQSALFLCAAAIVSTHGR